MDNGLLTALLSFAGTAVGAVTGIIMSARLTNYRIRQLEKKVEIHNDLVSRTYELEKWQGVCEEKVQVANHRIADLEAK